ncbi:diaminopimelate decarboxylase [Thiogranum longum]|uniref:Diaminopimelate decarboxylase n=1 Tax=Thiogranum longum TaxID=1537524 RepID=A0A4R1HC87_9GAMM|nr:diaminopimelate decarboxylase [Thiogranum longum]TCK16829.1 diaminopimelate decarboxylase [Thiogranum longum]
MDYFDYSNGRLCAEQVDIPTLADQYGTPLYVYSRATLERHWNAFDEALGSHPHLVCYAVKANSNLAVLALLARLGSGFDIVSGGELARVLKAGGDPARIVFSGVGKTVAEMEMALETGIRCFNVESTAELARLNDVAATHGVYAPVSLRVNPDVDAHTHPYISTGLKENKFGIEVNAARDAYRQAADSKHLDVHGIDCHIGSQLTEIAPFVDALDRVLELVDHIESDGIPVSHIDLGGGLGVRYRDEHPPLPEDYVRPLMARLSNCDKEILIEPGRAIAANAGVLVTEVQYLKETAEHNFAIVDAAMNDLLRPALYQAWQDIVPVIPHDGAAKHWDVVGPVCETGDFLGKDRELTLAQGDRLAVRSAGAYGFTMASNYNSRPRPAEILVDGDKAYVVRQRETVDRLFEGESIPDL